MRRPELRDFSEVFLLLLDYLQQDNSETFRCYAAVSVCRKRGILRPAATAPLFFSAKTAKSAGRAWIADPLPGRRPGASRDASVDQAVELAGVLAGDLVNDVGREAGELLLDVFRGFRPHPVGMRVVGAPHQGLDADVVDELGADRVELECRLALAASVFARLQLHQVAKTILELEINAVQCIGEPA